VNVTFGGEKILKTQHPLLFSSLPPPPPPGGGGEAYLYSISGSNVNLE